MRNDALAEMIAAIDRALGAAGVEPLFFKGPWLAFRAYPDPGTRPVGDIDLGIPESVFPAALAALRGLGLQTFATVPEDPAGALRFAHFNGQIRLGAPGWRPVEVHFRMLNLGPPGGDESWLQDDPARISVGGRTIRVPGSEAMALHLLVHANQHRFTSLRLLHDVRWHLAATEDLDWDRLVGLVHRARCATVAHASLSLALEVAGARVPVDSLLRLRPSRLRLALYDRVWGTSRARHLEATPAAREIEAPVLYLLEMGTLREKLAYLREILRSAGGERQFLRRATSLFVASRRNAG
jgi:hypothetical protein